MTQKMIVCGGNGAGKSTLGAALGRALGWEFRDIEDYYFPGGGEYKYGSSRTREEVCRLLTEDLRRPGNLILASVRGGYSEETDRLFTCAVYVDVPADIRMDRVMDRSFRKFGSRMLPGGDLEQTERQFFDMVKRRPENHVTDWLRTLSVPVIIVDGTCPVEVTVKAVRNALTKLSGETDCR